MNGAGEGSDSEFGSAITYDCGESSSSRGGDGSVVLESEFAFQVIATGSGGQVESGIGREEESDCAVEALEIIVSAGQHGAGETEVSAGGFGDDFRALEISHDD